MIHLDTSFLIRALVPETAEARQLARWLVDREPLRVSAVVWAELLCGPFDAKAAKLAERIVGEPLTFRPRHAAKAAALFNASGRRRGTVVDCMIAAVAIEAGATFATANLRDFERLRAEGLRLFEVERGRSS